jgi:hypothetical protein
MHLESAGVGDQSNEAHRYEILGPHNWFRQAAERTGNQETDAYDRVDGSCFLLLTNRNCGSLPAGFPRRKYLTITGSSWLRLLIVHVLALLHLTLFPNDFSPPFAGRLHRQRKDPPRSNKRQSLDKGFTFV